jgi:hypothetical protein
MAFLLPLVVLSGTKVCNLSQTTKQKRQNLISGYRATGLQMVSQMAYIRGGKMPCFAVSDPFGDFLCVWRCVSLNFTEKPPF